MTIQFENRERIPDFNPRDDFEPYRMNQMVQIVERRLQSLEESIIEIDMLNSGLLAGDQYAPVVHTHSEIEITDLGDYIEADYISGTMILDDISDVAVTGVQAGYQLVRDPTNSFWIAVEPSAAGGFAPDITAPQVGDVLTYDGANWVNTGVTGTDFVYKYGDVMGGQLRFPEGTGLQFGDGSHRLEWNQPFDYLNLASPRKILVSAGNLELLSDLTLGTTDVRGSVVNMEAAVGDVTFTVPVGQAFAYTDGTDAASMLFSANDLILSHDTPGQAIVLQARNAGDTAYETLATFTADGAAVFYNDAIATLRTGTSTAEVWDGAAWQDVVLDTRQILVEGTANEIDVAGGTLDLSADRTWTVGVADDAVLPGTGSVTVPVGTTAQEPSAVQGMIRFDSDTDTLRFVEGALPTWRTFVYEGGAFHDGFSDFVADEHVAHSGVTVTLTGDTNEIAIGGAAQDIASSLSFTVGIADDAVLPGTGSVTVPVGTTAQEPSAVQGMIRFDSDTDTLRFVTGALPAWQTFAYSGGAFHDGFSDFVAEEHLDWTSDISGSFTIHPNNYPNFTASADGSVPLSGGGTTNYLRADGTWAAPPGGSASNSFETHTVTDTDSGFTWSATGSAVATSGTDTLTLVSGSNIDIDVDATSKAIRITGTGGGASALNDLSDVTISTPGTGELFYKSSGDWVNTPQLILASQTFDVKQSGGFGSNITQRWYSGSSGGTLVASLVGNNGTVVTFDLEVNNGAYQVRSRDGLGSQINLFTNSPNGEWGIYRRGVEQLKSVSDNTVTLRGGSATGFVGFNFDDSSGNGLFGLDYNLTGDNINIEGKAAGTTFVLRARNLADSATNDMITADPDAGVRLLYADVEKLETVSGGIDISGDLSNLPSGGGNQNTSIRLFNSVGNQAGTVGYSTDPALRLQNNVYGGLVRFFGTSSGGTGRTLANWDPDGALDFYHAGTLTFSSINAAAGAGLKMYGESVNNRALLEFFNNGGSARTAYLWSAPDQSLVQLNSEIHGGLIRMRGEDSLGAGQIMAEFDPDVGVGFNGSAASAPQTYSVTNLTTDRTYDANATTVAELADVLGTLINDLRNIGLVN